MRTDTQKAIRIANRMIRQIELDIERSEKSTSPLRSVWMATLQLDLEKWTKQRERLIQMGQQEAGVIKPVDEEQST